MHAKMTSARTGTGVHLRGAPAGERLAVAAGPGGFALIPNNAAVPPARAGELDGRDRADGRGVGRGPGEAYERRMRADRGFTG
jgi:hypothetical protein